MQEKDLFKTQWRMIRLMPLVNCLFVFAMGWQAAFLMSVVTRKTSPSKSKEDHPPQSFTDLLIEAGTDKYFSHHYEYYYGEWFEPFRDQVGLSMVEIGIHGGKSLALWNKYFKSAARIIGVEYDPNSSKNAEETLGSITVIQGDQYESETMKKVCNLGPHDIIIDDGSHVPSHMVFSLFELWPCLKDGGIYVIEDTETSYWGLGANVYGHTLIGGGIGAVPEHSVTEKLKQFVDVLMREKINFPLSIMPQDETLCSISFGSNIVALKKCSLGQQQIRPPFIESAQLFNFSRIEEWLAVAKSSNPKGY